MRFSIGCHWWGTDDAAALSDCGGRRRRSCGSCSSGPSVGVGAGAGAGVCRGPSQRFAKNDVIEYYMLAREYSQCLCSNDSQQCVCRNDDNHRLGVPGRVLYVSNASSLVRSRLTHQRLSPSAGPLQRQRKEQQRRKRTGAFWT